MFFLSDNHDTLQELICLFAELTDTTIVIFDAGGTRIAATGRFKSKIGVWGPDNYPALLSMKKGRIIEITDPNNEEICQPCIFRKICDKVAARHIPLLDGETAIGSLSIMWYTREARLSFHESVTNYLTNMVRELLKFEKESSATHGDRFSFFGDSYEVLVDNVQKGVIALDHNYLIRNVNRYVIQRIGQERYELIGRPIDSIIQNFSNEEVREKLHSRFVVEEGGLVREGEYDLIPIKTNDAIEGYLMILDIITYHANTDDESKPQPIITNNANFLSVLETAKKVAKTSATVLIQGESGTGKELVTRYIHENSARANGPMISVNCGAIPENLLESELFGYESGTFTGGLKGGKQGLFQAAHTGTLFLDEIGEMPLSFQVRLLRVIESKKIRRVGSAIETPVDVRIIAATNQDLEQAIENKEFRMDLYYRLSVIKLEIPPLRKRKDDLEALANHFIETLNKKYATKVIGLETGVIPLFRNHEWPGNVRELQNLIEYASIVENGSYIRVSTVRHYFPSHMKQPENPIQDSERELILNYLNSYGWNSTGKRRVAAELKIGISTLYRKMSKYNIVMPGTRVEE